MSHRKVEGDKRVMLGEQQEYEPLCRECFKKELGIRNEELGIRN